LCGGGQTAPNPVLTTLKYFMNEYLTHIQGRYCAAAVCTALFEYRILAEKCSGCGRCIQVCSSGAVHGEKKEPHTIDVERCIKCRACVEACKFEAIVGVPVGSRPAQEVSL
jgi:Na+-translocating ferredoxin:NAD+ oxidoreductase RNF subunit RnfB